MCASRCACQLYKKMEDIIYKEILARISANSAWFDTNTQPVPEHLGWFEDQPNNVLQKDGVTTYPFDCPAVFVQFEPSRYNSSNGLHTEGEGVVILHIVQRKIADGIEGATNHADFKKLTAYAPLFIDLFDGFKLPCSARLFLSGRECDHVNRPLMIDRVSFRWNAKRKKTAGAPT